MLKLLAVSWSLLCLAGNVAQLFFISAKYFRYDVGTNVAISVPEFFDAPSFSFCLEGWRLLNWKKVLKDGPMKAHLLRYPDNYSDKDLNGKLIIPSMRNTSLDDITLDVIHHLIKNASTAETTLRKGIGSYRYNSPHYQFLKALQDRMDALWASNLSQLFDFTYAILDVSHVGVPFFYHVRDKTLHSLLKVNATDYYFKEDGPSRETCIKSTSSLFDYTGVPGAMNMWKCFLLEPKRCGKRLNYLSIRSFQDDRSYGRIDMFSLFLHNAMTGNLLIAYTEAGDRFYPHATHYVETSHNFLAIDLRSTYDEYQSTFLPSPYTTACRDYKAEGLRSKEDCYERCVLAYSVGKVGKLLRHSFLLTYPEYISMPWTINWQEGHNITSKCIDECRHKECRTVLYIPHVKLTERLWTIIRWVIPPNPVVRTETIEQVVLIQFLSDAASSIGFWFGLSVAGVLDVLGVFPQKLLARRRRKSDTDGPIRPSRKGDRRIHPLENETAPSMDDEMAGKELLSALSQRLDALERHHSDIREGEPTECRKS